MKRAVAIIRVSSKEQANDDRYSIPHQKRHIAEECERKVFELVHIFEFVMSGARVMKSSGREQKEILGFIEKNNIEVVIVHELDRLARSMIDTLLFVDELNKRDIAFVSVHDGFDTSTAQGQLQMQILAAFAEYFRKQLASKVLGGMTDRARQAKPMGRRPFGYNIDNGEFTIIEEEAKVVRDIFTNYAKKNKGLRAIAEELNKKGLRTASGNKWSHANIRDILENEIYIGNFAWGEIRIEEAVPAIVDRELFKMANERREQKKKMGGRAQNSTYLLSGLLRCGKCGAALVGASRSHKYITKNGDVHKYHYYVYRCQAYASSGKNACDAGEYRAENIEKLVLADLANLMSAMSYDALDGSYIEPVEKENLDQELIKVKKEITKLENMLEKAAEAFEAGAYDLEFFSKRKEKITEQLRELAKEKEEIQKQIEEGISKQEILERIHARMKAQPDFRVLIDMFLNGERDKSKISEFKKDLQQIIGRIVVNSVDEIEIYYKF